ncbi:MAG: hypothetical protein KDA63_20720 [Planctomycetales bacterium]|nr:hypothetical protein [Planctomycetales bacterium]
MRANRLQIIGAVAGCALALAAIQPTHAQSTAVLGLEKGTPDLKSAGPLAFGPYGVLLVGDPQSATVFAIDTRDKSGDPNSVSVAIDDLGAKLSELFDGAKVEVNDLAVNPLSGNVYLSVTAGDKPALCRVGADGKVSQLSLAGVPFSSATLPNAPANEAVGEGRRRRNPRDESITDLAFLDGQVIVTGLAAGDGPSNARTLAFPFVEADSGASLQIYHGAHGREEDAAPARTFVALNIGGEPSLLAGFTCTPLVRFPLGDIAAGEKVHGTTVAELGNHNRPLDMIVYQKGGKDYLLMANSARGVMKVSTDDIERAEGIDEHVRDGSTAGQKYETITELDGVVQLDRLGDAHAVIVSQSDDGALSLRTIELP